MHNSHQRHVHQGAQFNKIMREASKEQVEQFASIAIIHDGNHQLGNKTQVKAAHFGWEKETPHAKALNPQVIFIFLPLLDSGLCADVGGKCLKIQNLSWHMTAPHGNTPWPFFHTLEKGPTHIAASQASPRHVPSSLHTYGVALTLQWISLLKCSKLYKLQVEILNMLKKLKVVKIKCSKFSALMCKSTSS